MVDLPDMVSERPYISHEETREGLGLSDEDFAAAPVSVDGHLA